jgi:hypothetical protein
VIRRKKFALRAAFGNTYDNQNLAVIFARNAKPLKTSEKFTA